MAKVTTISGLAAMKGNTMGLFSDLVGAATCEPPYSKIEVEISDPGTLIPIDVGESQIGFNVLCKDWTTKMFWNSSAKEYVVNRYTSKKTGAVIFTWIPGSFTPTAPNPVPPVEVPEGESYLDTPVGKVGKSTKDKKMLLFVALGSIGGGIAGYAYNKKKTGGKYHQKRYLAGGALTGLLGGVLLANVVPSGQTAGYRVYERKFGSLVDGGYGFPSKIKKNWLR